MELPPEVPVMTLPSATLFPQALLPLYIFEPRYRQMLKDALESHRMFTVAMQKPGRARETPCGVAGLGLIRVSVGHNDGTSHLIMQGLARVELNQAVQYKPYRIQRVRPLPTPPATGVQIDALVSKVLELVTRCLHLGVLAHPLLSGANPPGQGSPAGPKLPALPVQEIVKYLEHLRRPEEVADLVSCALLPDAVQRQTLLETVELPERLRKLIQFLMAEIERRGDDAAA